MTMLSNPTAPSTSQATITVHTDRGPLVLPCGSSLADAVEQLSQVSQLDAQGVATAVNGEFVARGGRAAHTLFDGDTVLCFAPITGG